jgi:hypothetical protein
VIDKEAAAALKAQRDEAVARHRAARATYNKGMDDHAAQLDMPIELGIDKSSSAFVDSDGYRSARKALAEMAAAEEAYFRQLPKLAMACCPHCDKPLFRSFDPFGLDGLWWRSDAQPEEPQPCPHFCVMLGAVDLRNSRPRPDFDVFPGPGAPYVLPRLLAQAGMVAVISEIQMLDGAVAYPIAYFAPRRPPIQTLAAPWARTNFVYTTQLGVHAWRRADEPAPGEPAPYAWDFDLAPWAARGDVRWCDPGTDGSALSTASRDAFPFANVAGVRQAQMILAA